VLLWRVFGGRRRAGGPGGEGGRAAAGPPGSRSDRALGGRPGRRAAGPASGRRRGLVVDAAGAAVPGGRRARTFAPALVCGLRRVHGARRGGARRTGPGRDRSMGAVRASAAAGRVSAGGAVGRIGPAGVEARAARREDVSDVHGVGACRAPGGSGAPSCRASGGVRGRVGASSPLAWVRAPDRATGSGAGCGDGPPAEAAARAVAAGGVGGAVVEDVRWVGFAPEGPAAAATGVATCASSRRGTRIRSLGRPVAPLTEAQGPRGHRQNGRCTSEQRDALPNARPNVYYRPQERAADQPRRIRRT
jgi:hypothetical protein